tara:strand:- start:639 stop:2357 length:1719 start_codon:yes stop_codon:yes gene_type:complete
MYENLKFIGVFALLFLASCGIQNDTETSKNNISAPYSDTDANFKYNSIYNKLVIELLLHKNQYNEAIATFSANIQYFRNEDDFLRMINKARDLRKFNDITRISKRWLDINSSNISAHKIAFSNYIELADFTSADYHFDYLYSMYEKNNNKSYIDVEEILSRNIIINNIIDYFEKNMSEYDDKNILTSYVNILQKNNLDQLAVSYLRDMNPEKNRSILRKYSNSLFKLNNTAEAITVLENYINSLNITDRETSYDLLALYLSSDNQKAQVLINDLIAIDPSDDDFIFRVALLCFDKKKYDLSEKYFNILLSKSYASDNINFFLGQIDFNKKQYNEALLHYERITQGTFVNTKLVNVAKALLKEHDLSRAYRYLESEVTVKTNNDLMNLLSLKMSLHQDPYDPDKVVDIASEILQIFPENQSALYSRALAYEKKGDIELMSMDFEKMIDFDPYNSIALNAYGYSLSLHDTQLNYAEELIRRAINIDPGNPAILDSLAWILFLNGSYQDAYMYASLAYSKDQDPEIVSHYYQILLKNGLTEKANEILQKSLITNPGNNDLLQLLDKRKSNEASSL